MLSKWLQQQPLLILLSVFQLAQVIVAVVSPDTIVLLFPPTKVKPNISIPFGIDNTNFTGDYGGFQQVVSFKLKFPNGTDVKLEDDIEIGSFPDIGPCKLLPGIIETGGVPSPIKVGV